MYQGRSGRDESLGIGRLSATITPAAGGSNESDVLIQVVDEGGVNVPGLHQFKLWLSDAASGKGLTSTGASGTVQVKSSSGQDIGILTAKKALEVQTLETGAYTLEITDSSKTTYYVVVQFPGQLKPVVSDILETADYG